MSSSPELVEWLARVRSEYREMPGLCLTEPQARRLWNLDATTCAWVLDALVTDHFLKRTERASYVRADGPRRAEPAANRSRLI